jgi:hypothetical protein
LILEFNSHSLASHGSRGEINLKKAKSHGNGWMDPILRQNDPQIAMADSTTSACSMESISSHDLLNR